MILAILQARMSSTRLPGKVLKPILGQPMLFRQIERLKRAKLIDKLIVATSDEIEDDVIDRFCKQNNIVCFRGALNDVLDRFYQAAQPYMPDYVVRLTGDCPLIDPEVIDKVIRFCIQNNYDYASNTIEPTYPDGLDVEVFSFRCLVEAWREALLPSQREHVTPFIYQQPLRYKLGNFRNNQNFSHLRWTVDEAKDFDLVTQIYQALYPQNSQFTMQDILKFLDQHEDLKFINTSYQRNEGLIKSHQADVQFRNEVNNE